MKKILVVASVCSAILFGCIKSADTSGSTTTCTNVSQATEQPEIAAFLAADTLPFKTDTSGVYYRIDTLGTGDSATSTSTVSFTYTAWLLVGTLIGTTSQPIEYPLASTIPGFIEMARYFKKGTTIEMVIPSSLAYGCEGLYQGSNEIVPPNSVLYYHLTITQVQ
jgi:FKBP-type peptidyl-prolyl cis-trans isomerase FkpA